MDLFLIAEVIFLTCVLLVLYVYLGYPLLVGVVGRLFAKSVRKADQVPSVSFIITAFNEQSAIRAKLEDTLAIDYPSDRLEIIVASDCSDDATDDIVRSFADRGVKLVRQESRSGKTAAQNLAVERASGEIVHFSDATSMYRPDALRKIVRNFTDKAVGCVAGRLIYLDPSETSVGAGARSYWGYETFLKESESRAGSLVGVSGCIYAVRRLNYVPMYPEACSDFLIATAMRRQGLRTVFEPEAVCSEETNRASRNEMKMRIRVISQTFNDLWRNREMMNPIHTGFFAIQLLSHKLLRYSVPVFLFAALISSGVLGGRSAAFLIVFLAQVSLLVAAAVAWILDRVGINAGPLAITLYFVLANVAAVGGFMQFLRGERYAAWQPIRDSA